MHAACTQLIRNPFCSSPSVSDMIKTWRFCVRFCTYVCTNIEALVFFTLRNKYTRTAIMRGSVNFCVKIHAVFTQEDLAAGNAPQHVLLVLDGVRFRSCLEPGLFGRLTAVSVLDRDCVAGTSPRYTRSLFRRPRKRAAGGFVCSLAVEGPDRGNTAPLLYLGASNAAKASLARSSKPVRNTPSACKIVPSGQCKLQKPIQRFFFFFSSFVIY